MLATISQTPNPYRMNQGSSRARPLHASDSLELARLLGIWHMRMQCASQAPLQVTAQLETNDTL